MIELRTGDGELVASYSDSFTPLGVVMDAMERGWIKDFYCAWPAVTTTYNVYAAVGIRSDPEAEEFFGSPRGVLADTGFTIREGL